MRVMKFYLRFNRQNQLWPALNSLQLSPALFAGKVVPSGPKSSVTGSTEVAL